MKKIICCLLFGGVALAQKPLPVDAQVGIRIKPKISGVNTGGMFGAHMSYKTPGVFHRVIQDSKRQALFAYDLEVAAVGGATYSITARPAAASGNVPTLSSTSTLNCEAGGAVTIELLSNPSTGQKISDTVTLVYLAAPETSTSRPQEGRMHFRGLELWIDSVKINAQGAGTISGFNNFMIYSPGAGGVFFSTSQPDGHTEFRKVALIDGSKLRFVWDNHSYEVTSLDPILANGGTAEAWVFVDPNYVLKHNTGVFTVGTSRSVNGWFSKDEEEN